MKTTPAVRLCMGVYFFLSASSAYAQQLELTCPLNWSALTAIDAPDQDKIIYGIPARDWKKEHLDAMLVKEVECAETTTERGYDRDRMADVVAEQLYPNGLASIQRRDERLAQAMARQEQEAAQQAAALAAAETQAQAQEGADAGAAGPGPDGAAPATEQATGETETEQALAAPPPAPATPERDRSWIVWVVLVLAAAALYWQKRIRNRCTSCRSTSVSLEGETELDRWRGTKQVSEKNSRGTNTRHVQTTYVKLRFDYCCNQCEHEWSKTRKEELGAESSFGRFLSGY